MSLRVLLVDDHKLVRQGFRRLLEDEPDVEVVGEASNGVEAIELATQLKPDVVVMDMSMPQLDGVQATVEIRKRVPETAILVLSMYSEDHYVRNALEAGAKGYLLKDAVDVDLTTAVRKVAAGEQYLGPGVAAPPPQKEPHDRLTPREKQVLQLIAQGRSNKEIAALLGLSANTVAVHRANLMEALNIHRTADLVVYAIRHGLVSP